MLRLSQCAFLLLLLAVSPTALCQVATPEPGTVPLDEQDRLTRIRQDAAKEIFIPAFTPPEIAGLLFHHGTCVALVTISKVFTGQGPADGTLVDLSVDEVFRGDVSAKVLHARSLWKPPEPEFPGAIRIGNGRRISKFHTTEPVVGRRLLLTFQQIGNWLDGNITVDGVLDVDDPAERETLLDAKRFLAIDARTVTDPVLPLLGTLQDKVPWVRDMAARGLMESRECGEQPQCIIELLDQAERLRTTKVAAERFEGVEWLEELSRTSWWSDKTSRPDRWVGRLQQSLAAAVLDQNVVTGDKAFLALELFEFMRTAKAGECVGVMPWIRSKVRWKDGEQQPAHHVGVYATTCKPQPSAAH